MGAKILLQSLVQQHQVAYKGQWVDRGLSSCLQAVLEVLLIPRLSLSWQQCRGGATRKAKLCCLHVWTRLCVSGTCGGQKWISYSLELELCMVVGCHVVTRIRTRVLHRYSKPLSHLARPFCCQQLHSMGIYP